VQGVLRVSLAQAYPGSGDEEEKTMTKADVGIALITLHVLAILVITKPYVWYRNAT